MLKQFNTWMCCLAILLLVILSIIIGNRHNVRGIYLTQSTVTNTMVLKKIIYRSQAVGINTFVVDINSPSKKYAENIALIQSHDIDYVARIVLFPGGASPEDVNNHALLENRYQLMDYAVSLGAKAIQLDYVRYKPTQFSSPENAKKINAVIKTFHDRLARRHVPLEIAVFGIASFAPSDYIGQNLKLFSKNVDGFAPMLYPSHFMPYPYYSARPYQTILQALNALKMQFQGNVPVKVYAYIEASNYHYLSMAPKDRIHYISQEIKAVKEAKVDGFYVWSANNSYQYLFDAMGRA